MPQTSSATAPVPASLSDLDLLNLNPDDGTPPVSRMTNVKSALAIYLKLADADVERSRQRAKVDAMFDGVSPYDQAVLKSTGQGARTNVNFGESQRLLDVALSAYVDLYSSLQRLFHIKLKRSAVGDFDRVYAENVIGEELTCILRKWPELHTTFLRLATEFNKHGVGISYFDDSKSWKFRSCGLGDFLIPQQTRASEEAVEVACIRFPYMLHELWRTISDPEAAADMGWNVPEMKRVIMTNASNDSNNSSQTFDWERTEREFKNNDLQTGLENTSVKLVHQWAREFDGSLSFFIFAEDNPRDFLYAGYKMFKTAQEAFVAFTNGVGTNGTYHSVRGLGQRIFSHIQMSNRLRCQMVDSAMLAGSVMIQPDSERSLNKLSYTMYGPYSILPANLNLVEKASPDLSRAMQPALTDVTNQLMANADPMSAYGTQQASPYRNNQQVEHDLAVASRLTGSTLNLFYASWSRLLCQTGKRMINFDSEVKKELIERIEARGVSGDVLDLIDFDATTAVRAIGNGSKAARQAALRNLSGVAGGYDEVGRNNLNRDITSEEVGFDLVDRYAPPTPAPRNTSETKIAMLEGAALMRGEEVPVLSHESHGEHLRVHAPELQTIIEAIDTGEADPMQVLQIATVLHQHIAQHNAELANDKNAQPMYAAMNQLLQASKEIIENFNKRLMKMQREGQQQPTEGEEQGAPSPDELKAQSHQLDMQIRQEKAQQEMQIKQAKAQQDLALKDASKALDLQEDIEE